MVIELDRAAQDYVGEIGVVARFTFPVPDEGEFLRDYADNDVLARIIGAVSTVRPISLVQILHLGGYQLWEAVGNTLMHGCAGDTCIVLSVGRSGLVYEVAGGGPGYDVHAVVARFRAGDRHWQHKGKGFAVFDRRHVGVTFEDAGRTTVIRALASKEGAFYDYYLSLPIAELDGHTPLEAARSTDPKLRRAVDDWLRSVEEDQAAAGRAGAREWGYSDIAGALRQRLRSVWTGRAGKECQIAGE